MASVKVPVHSISGERKGDITLGKVFTMPVRQDVIRRAFLAETAAARQAYGTNKLAGKRTSAHYHGSRHYRYTMMNREMARMKRIHSQGFLNFTARFVPQATKGRKAHPPTAEKQWDKKINRKERQMAFVSALSATVPTCAVLEDAFQQLAKTRDVAAVLEKLHIKPAPSRTVRAGRGTMRGRKYRKKKGPLIIVSRHIPSPAGCDVRLFKQVTLADLAPGGEAGRVCIWTQSSIAEAGAS